jgi:hypothetical protein
MDRASVEAQDAVHWRDPKFRHFRDELDSALQQFERAQVRLEAAGPTGLGFVHLSAPPACLLPAPLDLPRLYASSGSAVVANPCALRLGPPCPPIPGRCARAPLQEWADLIRYLQRLQRVLTKYSQLPVIPDKILVAKRLFQCLNSSLPSGNPPSLLPSRARVHRVSRIHASHARPDPSNEAQSIVSKNNRDSKCGLCLIHT